MPLGWGMESRIFRSCKFAANFSEGEVVLVPDTSQTLYKIVDKRITSQASRTTTFTFEDYLPEIYPKPALYAKPAGTIVEEQKVLDDKPTESLE